MSLINFNFFDIHSHLQFPQFDGDREEVLARMKERGVGTIVVGTDKEMSRKAVEFAEKHDNIWAAVGQHPTDVYTEKFDEKFYLELAGHPKVVAIGECGLDYFHEAQSEKRKGQSDLFKKHIELALETRKPLMIHCRDAYDDLLKIIDEYPGLRGVVHFFVGKPDIVSELTKRGFAISFSGVITFTHDYDESVSAVPLDKVLADTDAPFVAPVPYRGKRNEPAHVEEIIKKMAEIRGEDVETVRTATVTNARRAFGVDMLHI